MKRFNRKGFTLAELLIVVAIIGVLVAIAIPVFNSQLVKARVRADLANVRSAYAQAMIQALDSDTVLDKVDIPNVKIVASKSDHESIDGDNSNLPVSVTWPDNKGNYCAHFSATTPAGGFDSVVLDTNRWAS